MKKKLKPIVMERIKLEPAYEKKGYSLLLRGGTVIYAGEEGTYIVPKESVKLLRRKKIKFKIV